MARYYRDLKLSTRSWVIDAVDLAGVQALAERVALVVRAGDVIALHGALGAGKTAFARFLIQTLLKEKNGDNTEEEVPSPSFSLVQSYDTARLTVLHFDFYRLQDAAEVLELGVDQEIGTVRVIEWAERAPEFLGADRLEILFEDNSIEGVNCADEERRISLSACGVWQARLSRLEQLCAFLVASGWGAAQLRYMHGDASARAYARAQDGARIAILMDSPKAADGQAVRGDKSYSALAHLAEDVVPFVGVGGELLRAGLRVPRIFAEDLERGFLLLEDLGSGVFGQELAAGRPMLSLWRSAVDVLLTLRDFTPPAEISLQSGGSYSLASYDADALMIELELLVDWYWPWARQMAAPDQARLEFVSLWMPLSNLLSQSCDGWVLRDYHSPNLMWLGGDEFSGASAVGVLDFQDAVMGHSAYDLVSLLQDARLDVPDAVEAELFAYYCAEAKLRDPGFDDVLFKERYAMFGAQRNTKILGIFARLAVRDGKTGYIEHMPRIWRYLRKNLAHPALQDLEKWYSENFPAEFGRVG